MLDKILNNNEEICSRFSDSVSHKVDSPASALQRDHPPAWELNKFLQYSTKDTFLI